MKRIPLSIIFAAVFVAGFASFPVARLLYAYLASNSPAWDTARRQNWSDGFAEIRIPSTYDGRSGSGSRMSLSRIDPKKLHINEICSPARPVRFIQPCADRHIAFLQHNDKFHSCGLPIHLPCDHFTRADF